MLRVVYLVFNEGYTTSYGTTLMRHDLSSEAIRLARLFLELVPDPEVQGLLALMLLHESRRSARTTPDGEMILLEDQDRSLWNRDLIAEGIRLVRPMHLLLGVWDLTRCRRRSQRYTRRRRAARLWTSQRLLVPSLTAGAGADRSGDALGLGAGNHRR